MFTTTINALNIARMPELLKLRKGHAELLLLLIISLLTQYAIPGGKKCIRNYM